MKKVLLTLCLSFATLLANPTRDEMNNAHELIELISQGKTKEAIALIEKGVDFYGVNYNLYGDRRPMNVAAIFANKEVVKALLKAGDKFSQTEGRPGALAEAMWDQDYKFAEFLVSNGANPNRIFYNDQSAITLALRDNKRLVIYMFVNYMNDAQKMTLFKYALKIDNANIYKYLTMDTTLTIKYTDKKVQYIPAFNHNYQDEDGRTVLMYAVEKQNLELISLLLSKKARTDIKDKKGITALDLANETNNRKLYYLIKNIASLDDLAFINAAKSGDIKKVKALLKKDINLEATDEHGSTAMIHAAAQNHPEIIKLLLKADSTCNVKTSYGFTPLMMAGNEGSIDAAKVLLDKKCYIDENGKPEFKNHNSWTRKQHPKYFKWFDDYKTKNGL